MKTGLSLWALLVSAGAAADCNPALQTNITADRYQINADNTVRDVLTDLIWARCPVGYSWSDALSNCEPLSDVVATFDWQAALEYAAAQGQGWRLPNTKELESIVKRDCFAPALETSVFSTAGSGYFWTSTPSLGLSGAWAVNLHNGTLTVTDKVNTYGVRLVKDLSR